MALEEKIPDKNLDLVMCDNLKCSERGEYIRCYFDIYLNCENYQKVYKTEIPRHRRRR